MSEPASLQAVLARFLDPKPLDSHRRRICGHLLACRTEAMGGLRYACAECDGEVVHYHGCRDRHCPNCQGRATRQWTERQRDALLPVPYYHLVFTLPHALNGWAQLHPEVIHPLLFEATWGTLDGFGRDPKRLDGQLGMTAVLHTWGQNLSQHLHLHCLVPGGAWGADERWHPSKGTYLFPVRALARRFRGLMVSLLRRAAGRGELHRVTRPGEIDELLSTLMKGEWVVFTKTCLNYSESLVGYLARYTHRIAISNGRIESLDERQVCLRYKDYRDADRWKRLVLTGEEFVRRFMLHILPKGQMRVRHFGFLANRCRGERLPQIRAALARPELEPAPAAEPQPFTPQACLCPHCRVGRLEVIAVLLPARGRPIGVSGSPPS